MLGGNVMTYPVSKFRRWIYFAFSAYWRYWNYDPTMFCIATPLFSLAHYRNKETWQECEIPLPNGWRLLYIPTRWTLWLNEGDLLYRYRKDWPQ